MNCNEVKLDLDPYIQDQLPQLRAEKIRRHLNSCPSCKAHHQDLQKKVSWLLEQRDQAPAPMPDYLEQSLLSRRPALPRVSRRRWLPVASVAACLALVIISMSLMPGLRLGLPGQDLAQEDFLRDKGINLPLLGVYPSAPNFDSDDADQDRSSAETVSGRLDKYSINIQTRMVLEKGSDAPYQLRYVVNIDPVKVTSITLILNRKELYLYFHEDMLITTVYPSNNQASQLTIILPLEDPDFPVHYSNYQLRESMDAFFRDIYLVLSSGDDTDVYRILPEQVQFTNNAN